MTLCGKDGVNSVTLCRPLSYGRRIAPSKEDGRTLEGGTYAYFTLAPDYAVTSGQRDASPPSPSDLCGHPRHCNAILSTAVPSPMLWGVRGDKTPPRRLMCAPRLPSAAPSSQRTDDD
jgi:hypothetical protein